MQVNVTLYKIDNISMYTDILNNTYSHNVDIHTGNVCYFSSYLEHKESIKQTDILTNNGTQKCSAYPTVILICVLIHFGVKLSV